MSVIIPVFGTEAYLPDCLASVLQQSFTAIEVIVVDDGSPGDVAGVVARVAGNDERIKLVRHTTNQGLLSARLTGGDVAKGAYLAHVDSDDCIEEPFVEALYATALRNNADLVHCAITVIEPDKRTWTLNRGGPTHTLQCKSVLEEMLAGRMSNILGNKLIRRTCWQAATAVLREEWRQIRFGEDLLALFHVALESNTYVHVATPLLRYIRRADSITMEKGKASIIRNINDLNRVYEAILPRLAASKEPVDLKAEFFRREFVIVAAELSKSVGLQVEAQAVSAATWPNGLEILRGLA